MTDTPTLLTVQDGTNETVVTAQVCLRVCVVPAVPCSQHCIQPTPASTMHAHHTLVPLSSRVPALTPLQTSTDALMVAWTFSSGFTPVYRADGSYVEVGTTPRDPVVWTSGATQDTMLRLAGLELEPGQTYSVCVRLVNAAGFVSNTLCTSGVEIGRIEQQVNPAIASTIFVTPNIDDVSSAGWRRSLCPPPPTHARVQSRTPRVPASPCTYPSLRAAVMVYNTDSVLGPYPPFCRRLLFCRAC